MAPRRLDPALLLEVFDQVANALQPAALVSTRLRRELATAVENAIDIESAIERAVRALRRLQPSSREDGKRAGHNPLYPPATSSDTSGSARINKPATACRSTRKPSESRRWQPFTDSPWP